MIADIAKGAAVLFVAAILQVTLLSQIDVFHGAPDLVLVTLVCVALLRGTIYGAAAGFGAGLVVDTATLQTLGVTSLLLIGVGYLAGRYRELRDASHKLVPPLGGFVATLLYAATFSLVMVAPVPPNPVPPGNLRIVEVIMRGLDSAGNVLFEHKTSMTALVAP